MPLSLPVNPYERAAVHYLRAAAIIAVLGCHLCEAYHLPASAVFYTGVPLLFFISGFLYGHKRISLWHTWVARRMQRIYVPYLIGILPALILFFIFQPQLLSPAKALVYMLCMQGFTGGPLGLNHLWFVTAILACYASLPILQLGRSRPIAAALFSWIVFFADFIVLDGRFYWLPLFWISYYSVSIRTKYLLLFLAVIVPLFLFELLTWSTPHVISVAAQCNLLRSLFTLIFAFSVIFSFQKYNLKSVDSITAKVSFYSYPFYLVHNLLVIGPFSLMYTTHSIPLNIVLALLLSSILTFCLQKAGDKANGFLSPPSRRA